MLEVSFRYDEVTYAAVASSYSGTMSTVTVLNGATITPTSGAAAATWASYEVTLPDSIPASGELEFSVAAVTDNVPQGDDFRVRNVMLESEGACAIGLEKSAEVVDANDDGVVGNAGDEIAYTYVSTNTGSSSLFDVTVSEDAAAFTGNGELPTPVHASGGSDLDGEADGLDLSPEESATWTATYTIVPADIDQGQIENQAITSGDTSAGDPVTDTSDDPADPTDVDPNDDGDPDDPTVVPLAPPPAISLEKSGDVSDSNRDGVGGSAGDEIVYTYVATNTGPVTVYDVTVSEDEASFTGSGPLPVPAYSAGGTDIDGEADDMDLAPGESVTWTATYIVTEADVDSLQATITNQATAVGTDAGDVPVSDTSDDPQDTTDMTEGCAAGADACDPTKVEIGHPSGELSLEKSGVLVDANGDGVVGNAGDQIAYTHLVTNTGVETVYDVWVGEIVDTFTGNGARTPTMRYDSGGSDLDGHRDDPDLDPGDTLTWTGLYTLVQADVDQGQVLNQSLVEGVDLNSQLVYDTSDDPTDPTDVTEGCTWGADACDPTVTPLGLDASISLEKTSEVVDTNDDGTTGSAGDVITYTYVTTNTGAVTVYDVTVTEQDAMFTGTGDLPAPAYLEGGTDTDGEGDDMDLAPGETVTWSATYTVTEGDVANGSIENQALTEGTDPNGDPVEDISDDPDDPTDTDANGDGEPDDPTVLELPESPVLSAPPVVPSLPDTGSAGVFAIIGVAVLAVLGGVVLLVVRRRS
ncbi:LPXTG-motif cell wall anchor domain-containing protein [Ruania alba]|uniref:LPXTG-motif cell wall anchor domain-containing protein n=1 Tax=Ruania alba TaxID=648782 RepID=A0A1H5MCZ0_9MICO|nr:LPXTG-motif cell wall anchor domain-containing protein [Ruania alba]